MKNRRRQEGPGDPAGDGGLASVKKEDCSGSPGILPLECPGQGHGEASAEVSG